MDCGPGRLKRNTSPGSVIPAKSFRLRLRMSIWPILRILKHRKEMLPQQNLSYTFIRRHKNHKRVQTQWGHRIILKKLTSERSCPVRLAAWRLLQLSCLFPHLLTLPHLRFHLAVMECSSWAHSLHENNLSIWDAVHTARMHAPEPPPQAARYIEPNIRDG